MQRIRSSAVNTVAVMLATERRVLKKLTNKMSMSRKKFKENMIMSGQSTLPVKNHSLMLILKSGIFRNGTDNESDE